MMPAFHFSVLALVCTRLTASLVKPVAAGKSFYQYHRAALTGHSSCNEWNGEESFPFRWFRASYEFMNLCITGQHCRCKGHVFACIVLALKVLRRAYRGWKKLTLFRRTPRSQAGRLPGEVGSVEEFPECWHANKNPDHPVCLSILYTYI